MTCKELTGFGVSGACRESGVYCRVLNVRMPKPIFDKREVCAGVEEVCSNGVLETVELILLSRQSSGFGVVAHLDPESTTVNRDVAV